MSTPAPLQKLATRIRTPLRLLVIVAAAWSLAAPAAAAECGDAGANAVMVSAGGVGCIKAKQVARAYVRRDADVCPNLFKSTCYVLNNWRCKGTRHYRRVKPRYSEDTGRAALVRCFNEDRWVKFFVPLSYV